MLPLVNDAYRTLEPYIPGKPVSETERELGITGVIKLASNENPYGPSPKAVTAISRALTQLHEYPDGGAFYLKQALAKRYGVSPEQIIVGSGSNELIDIIVRTCLRPGENMLFSPGTFIAYKLAAQQLGAELREVPLTRELRYDLPALARAANDKTKLVFIGNPNNPTGTYVTKGELEAFFAAISDDVLVVMDEAYFEYVSAADYPDGMAYLKQRQRLMVLRTFSKCYGLAGLRVGYGVANAELVDYLNRGRLPFNANAVAQIGALAALDDQEHVQKTVEKNRAEMNKLVPALEERGFKVYKSQANFVLVDWQRDGIEMFQKLLRQGVIVRPMAGYALPTMARITVGTPGENEKLLAAIDKVSR